MAPPNNQESVVKIKIENALNEDDGKSKIENGLDKDGAKIKKEKSLVKDGIKNENEEKSDMSQTELEEAEKKLSEENDREEEKLRSELKERNSKELQEQRYKRLMHLLNKSEFYSKFLLQRIESQTQEKKSKAGRKPKNKPASPSGDKENESANASSQEENVSSRGRKRKSTNTLLNYVVNTKQSNNENGEPASKRRSIATTGKSKKKSDSYDIKEVIDADTVRRQTEKHAAEGTSSQEEEINTEEQPDLFEGGTLKQYQLEGFSWLKVMFENGVNGILADEMGLGKTVQTIALVCHLVSMGVPGPFLVCAPLSTLPNWVSEFERFAPKIPCMLYHGSEELRTSMRHKLSKTSLVQGCPVPVFPVIITSYEVVIRDMRFLSRNQWRYIVVDEGHRLKNHQCRLTQCLKTYHTTNRLLLTGTPLQNDLTELWSLLNFLLPEIFDSLDVFESWFDVTDMMEEGADIKIIKQERETQVISTLHKILSPFLLRRVKADVDLDIPGKKELLVYTPMTELQLELYKATINRDLEKFQQIKHKDELQAEETLCDERGKAVRKQKAKKVYYGALLEEEENPDTLDAYIDACEKMNEQKEKTPAEIIRTSLVRINMANPMMQLRKIVNHPYLIEYPLTTEGEYKIDKNLLMTCGKLQVLNQLLTKLHSGGHKVLIFSQMTMMLDILEDYLTLNPKWGYKRLDGRVKLDDRRTDIKEFNTDPNCFIYLLSTRAGGLGINLCGADTAIIYDSDWNPQQDLQAQDRCHRIGQSKPVLVLRLVTASTIDERVVDRAATKRKLEKLIIKSGKFKSAVQDDRDKNVMDAEELMALLNQRDHDRIHSTKHGNIFSKDELDELLDRSDIDKVKPNEDKKVSGVFKVISIEKD